MSSTLCLDAGLYPRTYRVSFLRTAGNTALIVLSFLAPLLRTVHTLRLLSIMSGVAFALVFLLRSVLKVTLYADRIEVESWYKTTVVRRDEIESYRITHGKISMYVFELKAGRTVGTGSTSLNVTRNIRTDATWEAWLAEIPCPEAEARAAAQAEIENIPELGATPAARAIRWKRAIWASWGLWIVTLGLSLSLLIGPTVANAALAGLLAMPWLALALIAVFMPVFSSPKLSHGGPILVLMFLIPVPGLPLLLMEFGSNYHYVKPILTVIYGGIVVVAIEVIIVLLVRKNIVYVSFSIFAILFFSFLYSYQAISTLNYRLDPGRPVMVRVAVKEKQQRQSQDKLGRLSTSYELVFEPVDPKGNVTREFVSSRDFMAYSVGDTVCAALFSGGLGLKWYRLTIPDRPNTSCHGADRV